MKKTLRRSFAAVMALILLAALLLPGCSKTPAYESAYQAYCSEMSAKDSSFRTDGVVVYDDGDYYAAINGKLYPADTFTAEEAAIYGKTAGDQKVIARPEGDPIFNSGSSVSTEIADFSGLPYVEFTLEGQPAAKICNYYLEVTVESITYTVSFYVSDNGEFFNRYTKGDVQITKGWVQQKASSTQNKVVKNVIFMIADGGGYDHFTLADKVKQKMLSQGINKLTGAKTEITTNLLAGLGKDKVNGLYLNELLVGSANSLLTIPHGAADNYKSYITDSAAAGTALSTGYKTVYTYVGLDADKSPRASLSELARLNGMATGLVTTKSYMDATPQTFFTSHSIYRFEYQDNSQQSLLSGIDVVIGEGTEYGDLYKTTNSSHPDLYVSTAGYTVARSKTELLAKAADSATKKLWAPILGAGKTAENDQASSRLTYDVDADESAEHPSLLEMTQAALQVLSANIDDPDGFFLMVEGGALDNAAETGCLRGSVGEYLAFDEAFGYCVNWAAQRGDTIVIAVPDHDSGGFYGIEECEDALIDAIISGVIGSDPVKSNTTFANIKKLLNKVGLNTKDMTLHGNHTDMAVPISLYAPESVRKTLLANMGLPLTEGNIRTGNSEYYVPNASGSLTWYSSSALDNSYTIDNTKIAPAITETLRLGSLDDATAILFTPVGHAQSTNLNSIYGGSISYSETSFENSYTLYNRCVYQNEGLVVARNSSTYTLNGVEKKIEKIGNAVPQVLFVLNSRGMGFNGTLYVPYTILADAGLMWSITISCDDWGIDKVLYGTKDTSLTLPAAPEGKQILYTDGTNMYRPGDTLKFNGSNLTLRAFIK